MSQCYFNNDGSLKEAKHKRRAKKLEGCESLYFKKFHDFWYEYTAIISCCKSFSNKYARWRFICLISNISNARIDLSP
jgi:hypothetical protein